MRILIANVKLFCRCAMRWCLPTAFIVGLFVFPGVASAETVLSWLVLGALLVGIVLGIMLDYLTCRVGLFCLPRPYGGRRRLALFLGVVVAFTAMLVFVGCVDRFDVARHRMVPVVGSVFVTALSFGLLGAAVPLLAGMLLLGAPVLFSLFVELYVPSWPNASLLFERAVIHHPGAVTIAGIIGIMFSWFWLVRPMNDLCHWPARAHVTDNLFQRFCAKALAASERKDTIHPWISAVLLEKIRYSPHDGSAKHIWSSLYLWLHPRGGGRAELIGGVVFGTGSAVLGWYISSSFFLIIGVMLWLASCQWPVHSRLMTVGGRRGRFICTMVQLLISGGIFTASMILALVVLNVLQGYLIESEFRVLELKLGRVPLGPGTVLPVLILIPLGCLVQIALAHLSQRCEIAVWLALALLFVAAGFFTITISPFVALIAIVLSWLICTAGVHHIVSHSDLIVTGTQEAIFASFWRAICETVVNQQNRGRR